MWQKNSVVIVYENILLGEGISRYILTHTGVKSKLVPAQDRVGINSALANHPQVVILGMEEPTHQIDLEKLDPMTLVIDMRDGVERDSAISPKSAGVERIVRAVQRLNGGSSHPISM